MARRKRYTEEELKADLAIWIKANGGELAHSQLKKTNTSLFNACINRYKSIGKTAAHFNLPFQEKRLWTKEVLAEQFAILKKTGPITKSRADTVDKNLYPAACRKFGSWNNALNELGYEDDIKLRRTDTSLLQEVDAWIDEHGKLNYIRMRKTNPALFSALTKKFGSVKKAAAHYERPYEEVHRSWTRGRVIEKIKDRYNKDLSLFSSDIRKEDPALFTQIGHYFRAVKTALKAAGINDAKLLAGKNKWTMEEFIEELINYAGESKEVNAQQLRSDYGALARACPKYFSTTRKAVEYAGLKYIGHERWTDEEVLQELKEIAKSGPIIPHEIRADNSALYSAVTKRGGFHKFCNDHDIPYGGLKEWNKKELDWELRLFYSQHKKPFSDTLLRYNNQALYNAAKQHYESIENAARKNAIPFERQIRKWTAQTIEQRLIEILEGHEIVNISTILEEDASLYHKLSKSHGSVKDAIIDCIERNNLSCRYKSRRNPLWTKEKVIQDLQTMAIAKNDMRSIKIRQTNPSLYSASRRCFGTYAIALDAAAIKL
ncbi:MAG: hypothetical protein MJH11_07975 [Lentisphaeria bacterium]|nr:hypothetical protein [Lentisphaeria bacterium]